MQKVLVTGADGFIGRALCPSLSQNGYDVIALNRENGDITDSTVFSGIDSDVLKAVHLAALTYVPESWKRPSDFYKVNFIGTLNMLEFCRIRKLPLTYVSSYIYGVPYKNPIDEGMHIDPNNPYMHSKCMADDLCRFYRKAFNMDITILRPFNIYGPGQNESFLIPTIINKALYDPVIRVMDIGPKRDFVYISDLTDAIILTLGKKCSAIYNVGCGKSYSVHEIINTVQQILGTDKPVESKKEKRLGEINDTVADISKIIADTGWYPRVSLKDGLTNIISYEKGETSWQSFKSQ